MIPIIVSMIEIVMKILKLKATKMMKMKMRFPMKILNKVIMKDLIELGEKIIILNNKIELKKEKEIN
jgi:hypothetical protein